VLTGKQFRLRTSTAAIDKSNGVATKVPVGAIINVISPWAASNGMVYVLVEGRPMLMFTIDLQERGEEISIHLSEP
jgi:hypothetical protein